MKLKLTLVIYLISIPLAALAQLTDRDIEQDDLNARIRSIEHRIELTSDVNDPWGTPEQDELREKARSLKHRIAQMDNDTITDIDMLRHRVRMLEMQAQMDADLRTHNEVMRKIYGDDYIPVTPTYSSTPQRNKKAKRGGWFKKLFKKKSKNKAELRKVK